MQLQPAISSASVLQWPRSNRVVWLGCLLFFAAIWLGNPNYQWSANRTSPYGADFVQEWVAGDMLLSGASGRIYDRAAFQAWQHDGVRMGFTWPESQYYPAVYPPPYYCIVAPLAWLPYPLAATVWLGLLVAAYGLAAILAIHTWTDSKAVPLQLLWCAGLIMPAMFFGCVLGQKGSLWLLSLSSSVYLLKRQHAFAAGCVAAILTLKPTLCALIPLAMFLTGQWRFSLGFITSTAFIYGGSAWLLPSSVWADYVQVIAGTADYQTHAGYRSGWSTSLITLLTAVGTPKLISLSVAVLGAMAILFNCVRQCRTKPSRTIASDPLTQPELLWQLLIGTALLSPHAYFYDLTWLLLPLSGTICTQPRRALRDLSIVWIAMVLGQMFEYGPAIPAIALVCVLVDPRLRLGTPKVYRSLPSTPKPISGKPGTR